MEIILNKTYLYRHYDNNDNLIYVGISLSYAHRLSQHKDHSHWFDKIKTVKIETFNNRKTALEAETNAIKNENPKCNIQKKSNFTVSNKKFIKISNDNIINNVVNIQPLYSIKEAANFFIIKEEDIEQKIKTGELGYIDMGIGIERKITGFQILDYIEYLQKQPKQFVTEINQGIEDVNKWIEDCCIVDKQSLTSMKILYNSYRNHLKNNSKENIILSDMLFGKMLSKIGFISKRKNSGMFKMGLKIRT